jgi:hypothetical protein
MARVRRYKRVKTTTKSKYRFSKQKMYTDEHGNTYHYEGKNMGVFQFWVQEKVKGTCSLVGRFSEHDMDRLQLKETK